jgi:hypothetical protein
MALTAPNALKSTHTIWSDWGLKGSEDGNDGIFVGTIENEAKEEVAPGMAVCSVSSCTKRASLISDDGSFALSTTAVSFSCFIGRRAHNDHQRRPRLNYEEESVR